MKPSARLERLAGVLFPAAVREEVLGDLHERYVSGPQYLGEALLLALPLLGSRIRRTADAQLTLITFGLVYLSLLAAAWVSDASTSLPRLSATAIVMQTGMLLSDGYTLKRLPAGGAILGALLTLAAEALPIRHLEPGLAWVPLIGGLGGAVVLAATARAVLPAKTPRLRL